MPRLVLTLPFSCAACFLALRARSSWQRSLMWGRLPRRSTSSLMHSACTAAQAESVKEHTKGWLSLWQPQRQVGPCAAGMCIGAITACLVCLQMRRSLCVRRGLLLPATAQRVCASARPQPGSAGCAYGCRRKPAGRQRNLLTPQLDHNMHQLGQLVSMHAAAEQDLQADSAD